jgi:hypothetical protein
MRLATRAGLALAISIALGGCGPEPARYPDALVDATAKFEAATAAEFQGYDADGIPFPTAARLTTADARLGPWLFSSGVNENRMSMSRLAEQGVDTVGYTLAYPVLSGTEIKAEEYARAYKDLRPFANNLKLSMVMTVGPQYQDDNFLRGDTRVKQCGEDAIDEFSDYTLTVADKLRPDSLVLNFKPSTLRNARGCEAYASSDTALAMTRAIRDRVMGELNIPVGISADLFGDRDYLDALMADDGEHFIALSTLKAGLTPKELKAAIDEIDAEAKAAGRELAINELWIRKDAFVDGESQGWEPTFADFALIWRDADRRATAAISDYVASKNWRYAIAYESDALLGAGWPAERMQEIGGKALKSRRMIQLEMRHVRRKRGHNEDPLLAAAEASAAKQSERR